MFVILQLMKEEKEMIREIYEGDFRPVDNMGMTEEYQEKRHVAIS